jgi:mono/diheme cytochrome c family protein
MLLVAITSFMVVGCSGGGAEEEKGNAATEKAKSAGEESGKEVNSPSLLYTNNCGPCHGHDGSGVVGPAIKGTSLTVAQIEEKISNGGAKINTGGTTMPAFKDSELSDKQIKIIANYVKNELK